MILLFQDNLAFAGAFLVAAGLLSVLPILFSRFKQEIEDDLRTLITFHFVADILFILSIFLIQNSDLPVAHIFLALSCIFRISLILIAASNSILFTHMSTLQIIFLLITTMTHALCIVFGILYPNSDPSIITLLGLVYGVFIPAILWKTISRKTNSSDSSIQLVTNLHKYLQLSSRLAHRMFGPILFEWLVIRVCAGAFVFIRVFLRFISYASVQRTMVTSILVSIFTVLYLLRQ